MEPVTILILAALIVIIGNLIKGFFGFGGAFFSVPMLSLIMDIKFVVPVYLLFDLFAESVMCTVTRKDIRMDIFFEMLLGLLLGTLLGTYFLVSFSSLLLKRIFGVIVLVTAVHMFLNHQRHIEQLKLKLTWLWSDIAGFFAGLFGAMYGMNGPPLATYLGIIRMPKALFRATIFGISFVNNIAILALYAYSGLMTKKVITTALFLIPALLLGLYLGTKLQQKVDERQFRRVLAVLLIVVAMVLIVR
ncbi:sulfite exporter TauE/SafE family protein [Candidatus Woesearchaeota archaeon]|nr:sulfite exporter TauE/SafE family protein [Candidatus Woesearchaeota archaeon]